MDLRAFLMQSPDLSDMACADDFASDWKQKRLNKGGYLTRQEQPETDEFILLEGCLVSSICDQDGKEVSVGFYVGPCVITPNIARTRDGVSLVSIAATTDALLARIDSDLLSNQKLGQWCSAGRAKQEGRSRMVPRRSEGVRTAHLVSPSIPRL